MNRAPLNVPRLRVLYELTRRGSVTAVADALWITPSAVSQHLSALEREVGVDLVERAGRGVKPTDAGRRLALDAERVLAALDIAQSTAHELAAQDNSALRVAAFPSVVLGVLAPALARLRRTQPDLTVDVLDAAGRRRSPATMPGYHAGRPPRNKRDALPSRPADGGGDRGGDAPHVRLSLRLAAPSDDRRAVARRAAHPGGARARRA